MNFFDDLEFVCWGRSPRGNNQCKDRFFDGYWGLQFINNGRINLSVNGSETKQADGPVCFFTMPGAGYTYGSPLGETRDHYFICFKGERVKRYISGGLLPESPDAMFFSTPELKDFLPLWKHLLRHLMSSKPTAHGDAVLILEKLLFDTAAAASSRRTRTVNRESFTLLASKIADDPGVPWDFQAEAEKMGLSQVHFRRLFQEVNGSSIWQYVIGCRIRYAAQQLMSTDKLVKEIAGECGFNSVFHFSREFKKIMKKSPEHFRKSI